MSTDPSVNAPHIPRRNPLHLIHAWAIDHAAVVFAFYTAVVLCAVFAIAFVIPRRFAPYVPSPMLGIVTMMPGLSAQEMETYVSKPIEEQMVQIGDLHYIRSISQEGFSIVILEFNYGVDIQKARTKVQELLNVTNAFLPPTTANLKPSFVIPVDPLNLPILSLALTGDPNRGWTPQKLRQFADNVVIARIKQVPDVDSVVVFGGYRRQLQVIVDRNKLAAHGLSILDVRDAIDRYNQSQPGGVLTQGDQESIVRVNSLARSAQDVLNYPITGMATDKSNSQGPPRTIFIRDVAHVVDTYWERRSAYEYLDHPPGNSGRVIPAIEVSVIQNPAASSYTVVPQVRKVLAQLEQEYPGVHFHTAYDNAHFVGVLFHNVWEELAVAVVLTAIVIVFFLGEWRGTLIALITIPTSLAIAVLMLIPMHMTFNSGTLIGLLIAIGRLVDDTIIDIHSVERYLRRGLSPREATIEGIAEVRLAVLASTLMILIALLPLLFCGGITQLMFVELVWPLIFALLASMMVSFTLTAVLCAKWLRSPVGQTTDGTPPLLRPLSFLITSFQGGLERLEGAYRRALRRQLTNRFWAFVRIGLVVIVGFTFYNFIGSEMMPLADTGQAVGFLEMQPGTSFQATEQAVHRLEQILLKYPELQKASIEIGTESMFESWNPYFTGYQMPQANGASMMLTFSDKDMRKRTIWQIMDAVQKEAMSTIPGIRRLQIKEMGSDVMATADAPIHINLYGPNLQVLYQLGKQALAIAQKTPGLAQPALTWTMGVPDYEVKVDPAKAAALGLSPLNVAEQAYYALHGGLTNSFYYLPDNLRQDTILVRYDSQDRATPRDLAELYLSTPDGKQVPLESVAQILYRAAPTAIEHDNLRRVIGITGFYRKDGPPSMDLTMQVMMRAMEQLNFPPGYGIEVRGDMTQMMDSFRRLLYGLVVALVLMYFVLVAQFRGFLQPLQMIASIPLELSGVFTALWLAHQAFSTVSILGIIVLSGMDITTAVLMIDSIMRYRDRKVPREQAVVEGGMERLRPILMTALIELAVMLPVALAPKTGLDAYQPLGTTIVGGLLAGTLLSLFVIPLMHTFVDDLMRWGYRIYFGRDWTWSTGVEKR
ncbi:cation/multidrug efflux pump [Chthonomonas calidirosea]|uniref:Cation/multidrug efflux pump n=1 Tax=Chthonomonas calidirosea (strain DSM 23976 / ICMP 18418 / T49) TaxID=1303518 RepID=S0EWM2_CHTCT|nr:efflux RND transporter permease subunit [Chthonomonas calidirosea]CCW35799.1 Cation/multidrug efflux pump [Chthonomonas calidirosea T49]CEK19209.1 cation/multidrug efflux pump [Chthonomonas calidirosea]